MHGWHVAGVWMTRIFLPFCVLLMIWILRKELKKRKNDKLIHNDRFRKWLNIWSLTTMITCILGLIFAILHRIPYICLVSSLFAAQAWLQPTLCLTVYQIIRLQYIFSSKQVHSTKYGISNIVFVILYGNIGVLFIILYTIPFLVIKVKSSGNLGCVLNTETNTFFTITTLIGILWFLMWDLTVLSLYIFKNYQIQKNTAFNEIKIYQKIKFILHRIIILTVLYEIKALIIVIINFTTTPFKFSSVLAPLLVGFDTLLTVVIMYLMIEHNKEEYMIFMRYSKMKRLCYCCGSLQLVDEEPDLRTNMDTDATTIGIDVSSIDTKTSDTRKVKMNMATNKELTVDTVTVVYQQ